MRNHTGDERRSQKRINRTEHSIHDMRQEQTQRRWTVVVSAIIIQMCLGAVYAFSVLVPPLEQEFKWERIVTSPAFTIALLVFALSMIPAGRLQDKKGPKIVAMLGGTILGLGMILSEFHKLAPMVLHKLRANRWLRIRSNVCYAHNNLS